MAPRGSARVRLPHIEPMFAMAARAAARPGLVLGGEPLYRR
ncbi:hypothetical protein ABT263_25015 [Kitasatospora sp. NPDC001603]